MYWAIIAAVILLTASGICAIVGGALLIRNSRASRVLLLISGLLGLDYYLLLVRKRAKEANWKFDKEDVQ